MFPKVEYSAVIANVSRVVPILGDVAQRVHINIYDKGIITIIRVFFFFSCTHLAKSTGELISGFDADNSKHQYRNPDFIYLG